MGAILAANRTLCQLVGLRRPQRSPRSYDRLQQATPRIDLHELAEAAKRHSAQMARAQRVDESAALTGERHATRFDLSLPPHRIPVE